MNKAFQKIYCQLLLQQQIISKANNVTLITQWNIGDAWDSLKEYIGLGPSEAEKAARAAEEAAKNDPNKKIQKLAVQITDQDMNKAKALISKNPTLIKHYNNLPTVEDQKAFIVGLLAQEKAKADAEEAKKFKMPEGKEAQMFTILSKAWGKKWAQQKWNAARNLEKVICINKDGKPYAIPKQQFAQNADKYLTAAKKYAPQDETLKEDILDVLAKEAQGKDELIKMCNIYISAVGDEKKAKKTFEQKFAEGKICIDKKGKLTVVTKEKFLADTAKYITMAEDNNPNAEHDADNDLDPAELEAYNAQLKTLVTSEPLKMFSEKVFDIKVKQAAKAKQVLTIVPAGMNKLGNVDMSEYTGGKSVKDDMPEAKTVANSKNGTKNDVGEAGGNAAGGAVGATVGALGTAGVATIAAVKGGAIASALAGGAVATAVGAAALPCAAVVAGIAAIWGASKLYKSIDNINTVVRYKDQDGKLIDKKVPIKYELRAIKQSDFMTYQDQLVEALEVIEKSVKDTAETNAKADKQAEFRDACKKYQAELPAGEIANLCDTSDWGGNDFKIPQNTMLYNFKGQQSARWNRNEQIDSAEECNKFREFLNTGDGTDVPAHPRAIANVLSKLIDANYQSKEIQDEKQWNQMVALCNDHISKANAICSKYPEFDLK